MLEAGLARHYENLAFQEIITASVGLPTEFETKFNNGFDSYFALLCPHVLLCYRKHVKYLSQAVPAFHVTLFLIEFQYKNLLFYKALSYYVLIIQ